MSTSDWERTAPTERGYPQASRAFEWVFIALVFWLQIGGYLDGWAHQHLSDLREDFFTPWHAVLYSGFTAVMVLLGTTLFRNLAAGRPVRRTLPAGYELSLIGGVVFAVGGALDLIWHGVFGIEVNLEALISPTHLVRALGGFLIAGGPLRSAVVRAKSRERASWTAITSGTMMLLVISFMTQYSHPFARPSMAGTGFRGGEFLTFSVQAVGVLGVMLHTASIVGMLLYLLKHFDLPLGSITFMTGMNAAFAGAMGFGDWLIPAGIVGGILGDLIATNMMRRPTSGRSVRRFSLVFPIAYSAAYFAAVIGLRQTWWPIELWSGVLVLAGMTGLLLSYVAFPPTETELPAK